MTEKSSIINVYCFDAYDIIIMEEYPTTLFKRQWMINPVTQDMQAMHSNMADLELIIEGSLDVPNNYNIKYTIDSPELVAEFENAMEAQREAATSLVAPSTADVARINQDKWNPIKR